MFGEIMDKKNKNKKWLHFRHKVVRNIAFIILYPYALLRYHIKSEKVKDAGKRPYLILFNHQTPFDQFFVGFSFKCPVYYIATEDIFSNGLISSLLRYLVAPIPIKKGTTDIMAVKNCLRVAREGGTIALAPEGNRTYSGRTGHMNDSIAGLAKKIGLPIAIFRIEGGYGCEPRWSNVIRKGQIHSYVSRVIEPEEYKNYSNEELFSIITSELYVDEAAESGRFISKKKAEYLERLFYVCPTCGPAKFQSNKNLVKCTQCGMTVNYEDDKKLSSETPSFSFGYAADWYDYQESFIHSLPIDSYIDKPMFEDCSGFYEVIPNKRKLLISKNAKIRLFSDRIEIDAGLSETLTLSFEEITTAAVLGRNKVNLYHNKKIYQLKSDKRFNGLKYVNMYYHYKNITKGDGNGKFLGL